MRAAICHHLQQASARVLILEVFLQVRRKFINALGEQSNLHFRRTGILVVDPGFLCYLFLLAFRQHIVTVAQA